MKITERSFIEIFDALGRGDTVEFRNRAGIWNGVQERNGYLIFNQSGEWVHLPISGTTTFCITQSYTETTDVTEVVQALVASKKVTASLNDSFWPIVLRHGLVCWDDRSDFALKPDRLYRIYS